MAMKGLLLESSLLDGSSSPEKLLFRLGFSNLHVVSAPPSCDEHSLFCRPGACSFLSGNVGSESSTKQAGHMRDSALDDLWKRVLDRLEVHERLRFEGPCCRDLGVLQG